MPELEMLSWASALLYELIGLAHHCIWKIKLCCSKQQWARATGCGTVAQEGQTGQRDRDMTFRKTWRL